MISMAKKISMKNKIYLLYRIYLLQSTDLETYYVGIWRKIRFHVGIPTYVITYTNLSLNLKTGLIRLLMTNYNGI